VLGFWEEKRPRRLVPAAAPKPAQAFSMKPLNAAIIAMTRWCPGWMVSSRIRSSAARASAFDHRKRSVERN
jgi:hypothetical protein